MPKLLLSSTFLVPIGFLADRRLNALVVQALSFVAYFSFLGHKEWRFIIYAVPLLNIAAARGARALSVFLCTPRKYFLHRFAYSVSRPKGTLFGRVCFAAFAGMLFINMLYTLAYTYASAENYPGGAALARFNEYYKDVDNGMPSYSSTRVAR